MPERRLSSYPNRPGCVSLPDSFLTHVLPRMQDLAELKVVLYLTYLVQRKQTLATQGSRGSVSWHELKAEIRRLSPELEEEEMRRALESAVEHGILVRSLSNIDGMSTDAYSLALDGSRPAATSVFTLYEQNIGIITPMIAEELKEAEKLYPAQWIEDAFKEAVALNKRSWRYIARILERWATEGKDSGEHKRRTTKDDPDKYIKGKYGHLVKR